MSAKPRANSSSGALRYSLFSFPSLAFVTPFPLLRSLAPGASALLLCACATTAVDHRPQFSDLQVATEVSGEDPDGTAEYHILAGEMAASREEPAAAARHFQQALDRFADPRLAARATALALAAKDEELAITLAQRWSALQPDESHAREVLLRLNLRRGRLAEALETASALVTDHAGGIDDGLRSVAQTIGQETEHGDAAQLVMGQLVAAYPERAAAHYAYGVLALRFGKLERGTAAAEAALALDPASDEAQLLLISALLKSGDTERAEREANTLIARAEDPQETRLHYSRLLLESDHRELARAQLQRAIADDAEDAEARYILGLLLLESGDLDGARSQMEAVMESGQRRSESAYYLGRIAEQQQRHEDALALYSRVSNGNQALDAASRRAGLLGRLGRFEEAHALYTQLRRQFPQLNTEFTLSESAMLSESGRRQEALALLNRAIEAEPDDMDLRYGRSLVYEQLDRLADAEADLRHMIARNADDARALNALGYMLTVHTTRYREALALIERAYALTPEDAAVIDSLGWVQYRLGDVDRAHQYLLQAWKRMPDPEIAAHLGEVLWVMGRQDDARSDWQLALQRYPDHGVLRESVELLTR